MDCSNTPSWKDLALSRNNLIVKYVTHILDIVGERGVCRYCQKHIWWARDKKGTVVMLDLNGRHSYNHKKERRIDQKASGENNRADIVD